MTPQPSDWHHIAEQLTNETNPEKVLQLAQELNRVLGEREETSRRQQHQENLSKSFAARA